MLFNGRTLIFTFSRTQVRIAEHERLQSLFKMSMSERDEEWLIEVWQEKPCLYNPNLKAHSNRVKHRKRQAPEEIGAFINIDLVNIIIWRYYLNWLHFFDHRVDIVIDK